MTNKIKGNKKSLCEKTMQIAVNIFRVSSLSLAKKSMRTSTAGLPRLIPANHESGTIIEIESVSRGNERLRLQEVVNSSKLSSPNERKASYVIQDGKNVDGRASDYIKKFHEKNRIHSTNLKVSPYILPPPPPLIKQVSDCRGQA